MRQLATVRTISSIRPIPGADRIVVAQVDGWECVVQKDEFQVGQQIVYLMCLDILEKEDIITYREQDLPLLMSVRRGDYQMEDGTYHPEFFEMVSEFEKRLSYAKENTSLPEKPDMEMVEEFVIEVNRRAADA